jgi:hypothetical protein
MVGQTRQEHILSIDLEFLQSSSNTNNCILTRDISHSNLALNVVNEVTSKWR